MHRVGLLITGSPVLGIIRYISSSAQLPASTQTFLNTKTE